MRHPFFYTATRMLTRNALGRHRLQATYSLNDISDDDIDALIDAATVAAPVTIPDFPQPSGKTEANGQIIAAIIAFFQSPAGQSLIQALVALLISMIG